MINEDQPWRNEALLRMYYEGFELSGAKIAYLFDCSEATIYKWMRKHGIEGRKTYELHTASHDPMENDPTPWRVEPFYKLLYEGFDLSTRDIAWLFDCSVSTTKRWLNRHNIEKEPSNREKSPSIIQNKRGYVECCHYDGESTRRFYMHRLLAVSEYGYEKTVNHVVHHKNKIPWDNRVENIELLTREEHTSKHGEDISRGKKKND